MRPKPRMPTGEKFMISVNSIADLLTHEPCTAGFYVSEEAGVEGAVAVVITDGVSRAELGSAEPGQAVVENVGERFALVDTADPHCAAVVGVI
jgi:hypothetical protein